MIATQLAKFRLGVFPAAFPRSLAAAAAAATDSSNFFRQIKTKNAAIEHTKLNKHSRFIWWGKLQQQPRGWGSAAQPGGKLQENRATLVCSKRHEKPKCCSGSNCGRQQQRQRQQAFPLVFLRFPALKTFQQI